MGLPKNLATSSFDLTTKKMQSRVYGIILNGRRNSNYAGILNYACSRKSMQLRKSNITMTNKSSIPSNVPRTLKTAAIHNEPSKEIKIQNKYDRLKTW